jgi:signal transduction histidine kinase
VSCDAAAELGAANAVLERCVEQLAHWPDVGVFVGEVLTSIVEIAGAVDGAVFLYESSTQSLALDTCVLDGQLVDIQQDERLAVWRRPFHVDEFPDCQRSLPADVSAWYRVNGCTAGARLALRRGDTVVGLLELAYPNEASITAERLRLTRTLVQYATLTQHAASALEREQVAQERAVLARANAALRASSEQLVTIDNLDSYLDELMRAAARIAGASSGRIAILDPCGESVRLICVVSDGGSPAPHVSTTPPDNNVPLIGRARLVWDAITSVADHWRGTTQEAAFTDRNAAFWSALGHECVIAIPVRLRGAVLGMWALGFRGSDPRVTDAQVELVGVFAQQAGLAIGMTRLAESAKLAAVADERNRLARDIHDTLAQALALIVMQLADAQDKLGPAWETAREPLDMVRQLAVNSLAEARRSVSVLRPAAPTALGLPHAVHEAADLVRRYFRGRLNVRVTGTPHFVDATAEVELFGIVREALTNAAKHSRATLVDVELAFLDDRALRIVVTDNGQGFDPDYRGTDSYGLIGMHERAARIGAALSLVTEPGAGTEIVAVWPAQ